MALLSRCMGDSPSPDSHIRYLWRWGPALRNCAEEAEDGKAKRQPTPEEFGLQCCRDCSVRALLQLRVLRLGLLEQGNIRVRVFPRGEEILVSCAGLGAISQHDVGPRQVELRQPSTWILPSHVPQLDRRLKFILGLPGLMIEKVSLAAQRQDSWPAFVVRLRRS